MKFRALLALTLSLGIAPAVAQTTNWPNQIEGDYVIKDFRFADRETIPCTLADKLRAEASGHSRPLGHFAIRSQFEQLLSTCAGVTVEPQCTGELEHVGRL